MNFCVLASGSKGNSVFVESHYARILVDVGLSARQIETRLKMLQIDPASIDAIVLTHAHNDHVRGAGVFARRFGVPIYAHPQTLDDITHLFSGKESLHPWNESFQIKDMIFEPFALSHDCFPTVGYLIQTDNKRLALCTDLGMVTEEVRQYLPRANAIILESNHDPEMLLNGPYPWHLKERIASRLGHLSNQEAGELLQDIAHAGLSKIILGHLSDENNTPEIARETVYSYIGRSLQEICEVIEQRKISNVFTI